MVADKVISTLSGSICPDDDEMTMIEAPCVKTGNFDGARIQDVDTNMKDAETETSLDNFCEVVLSYRCKFCPFVATDRLEVKSHVKSLHPPATNNLLPPVKQDVSSSNSAEPDLTSLSHLPPPRPEEQEEKKRREEEEKKRREEEEKKRGEEGGEKDEVFFCSECSVIFSSASLCYDHMVQVHNLQAFSTDLIRENPLNSQQTRPAEPKRKRIRCAKQPVENSSSKRARPTSSNGEYMCKLCKTKFSSPNAVQIHERCHIAATETPQLTVGSNVSKKAKTAKGYVKGYTCCYCEPEKSGGKFLTWGKCASHLWKDHEIDCDLYTCSVCKYKTPILAKLKDHELLHSSEAKFTCSTCRKSFKQFKQLKTHEKYHKTNNTKLPPPNEARWYTPKECPVCNRILSDSKCLKKHISAVHNKMKPYVCNICGHTSARKAELKLHVRQHTGEKPYKCPACPFSTGDHNSLRKHKIRHADSRPYECPHCDYSAIQSHAFKKHVLAVHAGQDVVFVCPSCPLVTVNEKTFEAHRKDHEEGRIPTGPRPDGPPKSPNEPAPDESTQASSSSSSESHHSPEEKSSNKFWLRDEDSCMEVVDTGGITIPANESDKSDTIHGDEPEKTGEGSSSFEAGGESVGAEGPAGNVKDFPDHHHASTFGSNVDETRAVSMVAELLAEGDSNTLNQFFMDPLLLNDASIDLPDILCNEHSNDGTLEKLLNMNVTGFS